METAYVNGFSPYQTGCHVIIGDGLKGTDETIVPINGEYVKEAQNLERGEKNLLITRMSRPAAELVGKDLPLRYDSLSGVGIVGELPVPDGIGKIVVATGGTSDMPVAEEAALTAECMGNEVVRLYDVGVAGIHRLFAHAEELMSAQVVVAIAGICKTPLQVRHT